MRGWRPYWPDQSFPDSGPAHVPGRREPPARSTNSWITAADYFDRELDYKLSTSRPVRPAVILFVGVIVGFVAIALVSAMYGIYRQVHVT